MVSGVDLFGLIAALGTQNANVPHSTQKQWRKDNPQLSSREDMFSFLNSGSASQMRVLSSGDATLNNQPYILHTTNEFYANKNVPQPYDEPCHVLALRTPNSKIVYNYDWAASVYQFPTGVSNLPDLAHSEYYNLQSDPGERTNLQNSQSTSVSAAAQTTYAGLISSELQAPLPTVNGINLSTVMNSAGQAYTAFIAPPVGLAASYSAGTLTITATSGVSAGPKIDIYLLTPPNNVSVVKTIYIEDTVPVPPTASQPFNISISLTTPGNYKAVLTNTSGSSGSASFTVS